MLAREENGLLTPPGLAPASYRMRSARFGPPEETPFGQAVDDFFAVRPVNAK